MALDLITGLIVGIGLGSIFFILDYYNEGHCIQCRGGKIKEVYLSLIAGISIAYFFLELLPKIITAIPDPSLEMIPFLAILIGFTFIHLSEKLILQRIVGKLQRRIEDIQKIEIKLEQEEDNIRDFIRHKLIKGDGDKEILKKFAQIASEKHHKELELMEQEKDLKIRLTKELHKELDEIHAGTNFLYHFLIGLILLNLLTADIFGAIFFFLFAFFKAELSNTSNRHVEFKGINIHMGIGDSRIKKSILPASVLFGVLFGFLFELFYPLPAIFIQSLFAFVSGTILYVTVKEVIPEKAKGKPTYFLLGVFIFSSIILLVYFIEHLL